MKNQNLKFYGLTFLLLAGFALCAYQSNAQQTKPDWKPNIPKMWVDAEMAELEVPLADAASSPKHVSAEYYYRMRVRPIYKTYPVYAPGKEPPGYLEMLKQQEPEIIFDPAKLKTEADWIKAGEVVFDAPIAMGGGTGFNRTDGLYVRDPRWFAHTRTPVSKDGIMPSYRYVIAEKGKVQVGVRSCGMCHTRVMPDGSIIKGAQGNFPFDRAFADDYRVSRDRLVQIRELEQFLYYAPWVEPKLETRLNNMAVEEIASAHDAIPPGVIARHRSSVLSPVQVPDLIGVKERRYLDRSGLQQHHSLVDLMRYAALNQGGDDLSFFGAFSPRAFRTGGKLPEPERFQRYSDEQLYALALYLYSLKPPPNPNKFDALAQRGQKVFTQQGCAGCHTPPLYTNNKLLPVDGFTVPPEHKQKYDILPMSVGTDPRLALTTRRGTGYYKVPSLKGVWYRGPFEHNGSVATLEDWFDAKRLKDDYVPTGFVGYGVKSRAVKGHEFGLALSAEDKRALIAFLKTL